MSKETELDDQSLLERFVLQNPELEELEKEIAGFNIFQAIGMGFQEIRHSKTLAYFLDPSEQHGFGQYFLKRVLMGFTSGNRAISPIEIDCGNFMDAEVRREWKNIDILIKCPSEKIVVVIENKINASEHGEQLKKYYNTVNTDTEFTDYKKLFVFLTKGGDQPESDEDREHWILANHTHIVEEIEYSAKRRSSYIGPDQMVLITHYIDLMKRYVLGDSKISKRADSIYRAHKKAIDIMASSQHNPDAGNRKNLELAQKIYKNHEDALEIIFEHLPKSEREASSKYFKDLVDSHGAFETGMSSETVVRFWPKEKWNFAGIDVLGGRASRGIPILFEAPITANTNQPFHGFNIELVIGNLSQEDQTRLCREVIKELHYKKDPKIAKDDPRAWRQGWLKINKTPEGHSGNEATLKKSWEAFVKDESRISEAVSRALDNFRNDEPGND